MYLKSLELSGFKSFAKKENISFKSPITCIVGPNGSGKSNVAEAFRFVLGEQSIKSMRGKKGEDLIWNGGQEIPRAGRAAVKAMFDNSKRIFDLDFDEVIVERVVNRDGVNEYFLNGSQVRLKDVLELLSQAHVGASGHHIISQGEADRILSSTIMERKMMVEDALGLKIYQYKRAESERKLSKTKENIGQVESLRKEIAPHLRFLKKQMEKADKASELKDKLGGLFREYLKREKIYIEAEKEKIKKDKKPLLEEKEKLSELMDSARSVLELSSRKDEKSDELLNIEEGIRQSRASKEQLDREAGKIEGEIEASQRLIEKTERKIEAGGNITITLREFEELVSDIEKEHEINEVKSKIRNFLNSKKTLTEDSVLNELRGAIENLKKKQQDIEAKIVGEEAKLKKLDELYRDVQKKIEREKDSSREAEKEIFRISSEQALNRSKMESLDMKESRLHAEEGSFLRWMEEGGIFFNITPSGLNSFEIKDHNGKEINQESILSEARNLQEDRVKDLERMKIRLEELGANIGEDVVKEFKDVSERDQFLERELSDLNNSMSSLEEMIDDLESKINTEFKQGIGKINSEFQKFFSLMFGGGSAKLEIVEQKKRSRKMEEESEEVEETEETQSEEGVDIEVSLPKKRIKGLEMLSGGERALTSIALLFAISQVNPPPFIILDETDAALDEANSRKYGDMIEALSKYSQLILITHNRETMSRAGIIYGVTMSQGGSSKLLSIAFDEAVSVAK